MYSGHRGRRTRRFTVADLRRHTFFLLNECSLSQNECLWPLQTNFYRTFGRFVSALQGSQECDCAKAQLFIIYKPASFEEPVSETQRRNRFTLRCFCGRGCTAAGRSGSSAGKAKKSSHPWHFRCWSLRRNVLECTDLVHWTEALHHFSSRDAIIVVGSVLEKHFDGDFTPDQEKEITFKRWPPGYQSWKLGLALNGLCLRGGEDSKRREAKFSAGVTATAHTTVHAEERQRECSQRHSEVRARGLSGRFRLRAYRTVQTRPVSSRSVHHGIFPDVYFYTQSLQRPHERRPMASRREQVSALFFAAWTQRRLTECFPWATEGPNPPKETLTFKKEYFSKQLRDHYPRALRMAWQHLKLLCSRILRQEFCHFWPWRMWNQASSHAPRLMKYYFLLNCTR